MNSALPFRHVLLALLVASIWGFNFVVIKVGLREMPPLLLCALRFLLVACPAVFFFPRPDVPFRRLLQYGLLMFAFHFGFLFLGMKLGLSAGLASLALQVQVFITIGLAVVLRKERPTPSQVAGALVAAAGLAVVAAHTGGEVTAAGLLCALLAAVSWGAANATARSLGKVNALALVVWGSLVVPLPMLLASAAFEGPAVIRHSLTHASGTTLLCIAFIVYVSTHVGFSVWSWLLARHAAAAVTPFALLVPVVGMLSSALVLGEALPGWKLVAAALVIGGLAVNVFGPRLLAAVPALSRA